MTGRNLRFLDRRLAMGTLFLLIALVGGACSGGAGGGGGGGQTTITLGAVDNPSMADLKKLVPDFQSALPNIKVNIVTLPEDQIRQQVTQDVATQSGRFDLFTIGTYEVPLWAKLGWLQNLNPYIAKDSSYAPDDLIPGIKTALTYQNDLYAVPFYGESSMLMYRKDLLAAKPGAGNAGFTECLNAYNSGKVAMWYDATVAASFFTGDAAKNSSYAYAPTKVKDWSG